ncbi:hypothetical protein BJ322DRAFT_241995 [Thelephora terrestris]|uniref:Uncharacterized protein n=1 Tax=Thelephora terrestris TaxID=56493 RepID=A0A9P6H8I6_9AGAM|nr:hypothetical protein BJ322DRAFT_241995 [Thelephora terrestris]
MKRRLDPKSGSSKIRLEYRGLSTRSHMVPGQRNSSGFVSPADEPDRTHLLLVYRACVCKNLPNVELWIFIVTLFRRYTFFLEEPKKRFDTVEGSLRKPVACRVGMKRRDVRMACSFTIIRLGFSRLARALYVRGV